MLNALLVTVVHVKMKLGDNALNNERLSLVKLPINQRKTIVNSWVRCLENNQIVINSGFPTVNCGK